MNLILRIRRSGYFWTLTTIIAIIATCGIMGVSPKKLPGYFSGGGIVPPSDAKALCTVSPGLFASWFTSGSVTLNGPVNPANGLTFSNAPNCSFYQWAEQMFLWLTSPAPPSYGGGDRVFDSPIFFDVTPPDSLGERHFIPHSSGLISSMAIRVAQVGPHGLQVMMSSAGSMFELVDPVFAQDGHQLILDGTGKQVEIGTATLVQGKPVFFDPTGVQIQSPRPIIPEQFQKIPVVQAFPIEKASVFLDIAGDVVEMEQGQAGGNAVLRSRNGSLVYYASMVNDVYAFFLTGAKTGAILPRPVHFPTTPADLARVTHYGDSLGVHFPDSVALAVELKTSWVEASTLTDPGNYIMMTATIPTYDTTNPVNWVVNGQKTVKLAMVGMHVVGSTIGHPEMIWATFEHFENTPNNTFAYVNTSNATVTVPSNTAGSWLFCDPSSAGPFNVEHMSYSSGHIVAATGFTVSYSNTMRQKAWGGASDVSPNPVDATPALSNTEIISINNSVRGQLIPGDIRENYILGGATWTIGGQIPTGSFPSGNAVGTSKMSNSTMETYQQGASTLHTTGTNCFDCHGSTPEGDGLADTAISHIYGALQPLSGIDGLKLSPALKTGLPTNQLNNSLLKERLRIFPNPVADLANVEITVTHGGNGRVVIGDMSGRIWAQQSTYLQAGTNLVSLPVSSLSAGTYFVKVFKDDGSSAMVGAFFKP